MLHEALGVLYTSQRDSPIGQSIAAVLLVVLKFALRTICSWFFRSRGQLATGVAIFEIKFFNMLYTSIFTQKATSGLVLFCLLGFDAAENVYYFFRLNMLGRKIHDDKRKDDLETRRVLYKTEYVALLQLLEVITPIIYGLILCLIRWLPNGRFFEELDRFSDREFHQSLGNLAALSGFELISMTACCCVLRFRYQLPVLYQIGFYVSQNKTMVFALLNLWSVTAITGPYKHFGNDYSFRFSSSDFTFY